MFIYVDVESVSRVIRTDFANQLRVFFRIFVFYGQADGIHTVPTHFFLGIFTQCGHLGGMFLVVFVQSFVYPFSDVFRPLQYLYIETFCRKFFRLGAGHESILQDVVFRCGQSLYVAEATVVVCKDQTIR